MKINILLMTYNGSEMIKEVITSFCLLGQIHVFIDRKTTDNTEEIVRKLGIIPEYFTFTDFASSRNEILKKFPEGYRIFIDDSYLFRGDIIKFKKELLNCSKDIIAVNILNNRNWTSYSKITRTSYVYYRGKVHEFINRPKEYTMQSGYFEDIMTVKGLQRTIERIPTDLEIMLNEYFINPRYERAVYYIVKSLLILFKFGLCERKYLIYWVIQLKTMPGNYNNFGKNIFNILKYDNSVLRRH